MKSKILDLEELVQIPVFNKDEILLDLFQKAEALDYALFYIANFSSRKFEYMSPSCFAKTKYSLEFFIKGGADALYHLAVPETKLTLAQQQAIYLNELKDSYAPTEVKILEFDGRLTKADGELSNFLCLSLILTYTEYKDVDISIILLLLGHTTFQDIEYCREILRKIKIRHNAIFRHVQTGASSKPLTVIHVSSKRTDMLLTKREEEALKYLAEGLSTKDIAATMGITSNTVETYRKNLLEKFEARNVAELIKKASKIYWLE